MRAAPPPRRAPRRRRAERLAAAREERDTREPEAERPSLAETEDLVERLHAALDGVVPDAREAEPGRVARPPLTRQQRRRLEAVQRREARRAA